MIKRCHGDDPSRADFRFYQGAGITVCERWRSSFLDFLSDMGGKPTSQHTIERRNSAGNYEPDNCVWATRKQQANNTKRNRRITANGETRTLAEWSELTGLKRETISDRLEYGWSAEKAINTPLVLSRVHGARGKFVSPLKVISNG
jgi:hypothetical protein